METKTVERPEFVTDEHLEYLDALRESGVTNMYGAGAYLKSEYPSLKKENRATEVLCYWMETFSQRHPKQPA